ADALKAPPGQRIEPGETQSQVRAALVIGDGVNLIDDHGARGLEHLPALFRGEQDEQRLGRGNQDVRRRFQHLLAIPYSVSPVRSAVRIAGRGTPCAVASCEISASGASRFFWI